MVSNSAEKVRKNTAGRRRRCGFDIGTRRMTSIAARKVGFTDYIAEVDRDALLLRFRKRPASLGGRHKG